MKAKSQDRALANLARKQTDDPAMLEKVIERMLDLSAKLSELERTISATEDN